MIDVEKNIDGFLILRDKKPLLQLENREFEQLLESYMELM